MEELSHSAEWAVRGEGWCAHCDARGHRGWDVVDMAHVFGLPGCLNDIKVPDSSPLFKKIRSGTYPPPIQYKIVGVQCYIPYWLADGIYQKRPILVQKVTQQVTRNEKLMDTAQYAARKDVER